MHALEMAGQTTEVFCVDSLFRLVAFAIVYCLLSLVGVLSTLGATGNSI